MRGRGVMVIKLEYPYPCAMFPAHSIHVHSFPEPLSAHSHTLRTGTTGNDRHTLRHRRTEGEPPGLLLYRLLAEGRKGREAGRRGNPRETPPPLRVMLPAAVEAEGMLLRSVSPAQVAAACRTPPGNLPTPKASLTQAAPPSPPGGEITRSHLRDRGKDAERGSVEPTGTRRARRAGGRPTVTTLQAARREGSRRTAGSVRSRRTQLQPEGAEGDGRATFTPGIGMPPAPCDATRARLPR